MDTITGLVRFCEASFFQLYSILSIADGVLKILQTFRLHDNIAVRGVHTDRILVQTMIADYNPILSSYFSLLCCAGAIISANVIRSKVCGICQKVRGPWLRKRRSWQLAKDAGEQIHKEVSLVY